MRRLMRVGIIVVSSMAAVGMMSLGGTLSASAAPAPTAIVHSITITAHTPGARATCGADVVTDAYVSAETGYWTIKAWFDTATCGFVVEAAITCNTTNVWGAGDSQEGSSYASFAGCNKSHPTPEHGGFRVNEDGTWVYYTDKYTSF